MSSSDVCHLPPVSGPCSEQLQRYAYSPDTGTCQPFVYSGCEGNANNFETAEECQQVCGQPGESSGCAGPHWAGLGCPCQGRWERRAALGHTGLDLQGLPASPQHIPRHPAHGVPGRWPAALGDLSQLAAPSWEPRALVGTG